MRHLGDRRRGIRLVPDKLALARLLLDDRHVAVFLIQEVKTALNAEDLTEE